MRRFLETYSACLSFLTIVMLAAAAWVTVFLSERATWSGAGSPPEWTEKAAADDRFVIAGHEVAYWGKPDATYSKYATRRRRQPVAVVVHHTSAKPVENLVRYGHVYDPNRGGAFGYHFYVGRDGSIVQGAPLSRRTNHVKFMNHKQRRPTARHLWSGNTVGVSLVGACDPVMRPDWRAWSRCTDEFISPAQLRAGLAVVRALQAQFKMTCSEVYGHGDLQLDREAFEGVRLARLARRVCAIEESEEAEKGVDEAPDVAVQAPPTPGVAAQAAKGDEASGSGT